MVWIVLGRGRYSRLICEKNSAAPIADASRFIFFEMMNVENRCIRFSGHAVVLLE